MNSARAQLRARAHCGPRAVPAGTPACYERRVSDPFDEALLRGARLFDRGEFFEAHEAWEERWLVETDATTRRFFQGLIQVAAGFHKLVAMRDPESASRLLARGLEKLDGCPAGVAQASIEAFREGVRAFAGELGAGRTGTQAIPKLGV